MSRLCHGLFLKTAYFCKDLDPSVCLVRSTVGWLIEFEMYSVSGDEFISKMDALKGDDNYTESFSCFEILLKKVQGFRTVTRLQINTERLDDRFLCVKKE